MKQAKLSGDESTEAQESETAEEDITAITVEENPPANDPPDSEPAITSMGELTRHFREHYARRIFKEVGEVRLPGTISKGELSLRSVRENECRDQLAKGAVFLCPWCDSSAGALSIRG